MKFIKYWFKDFFKKPVKILFTLMFIMLVLVNGAYYSDIMNFIAEYFFWFVFIIIGAFAILGLYNWIYLDVLGHGEPRIKLSDEEVKQWNEFYKDQPKKQIKMK
ncbi:hypothetical protein M0Q50_10375 [bacterium]|jgi:hypothetical protein|nr:hypothetical protein [bacterium]